MKKLIFTILPFMLASCSLIKIITVENTADNPTYSTTVTNPINHSNTTTRVYAASNDISQNLDLQAVAAAFAQAANVKEFEALLNNSSYMLSNLDLNCDGYVDYLRVMSTREGTTHVFVIQAVLDYNVYQDVATLVAEIPSYSSYHVEVIGSPYIYGPNYIVRPAYYSRPYIFTHLCRYDYTPWRSPWSWRCYPSHYRHPAPVYWDHYHAYVTTYMRNHRYCKEVVYVNTCHYPSYNRVCQSVCRNDYGQKHPERSFAERNANTPTNARDIRNTNESNRVTTNNTTTNRTTTSRGATTTSSATTTSRGATTTNSATTTSRGATTTSSATTTSRSTTTTSRVSKSGTASTTRSTSSSSNRGSSSASRSTSSSSTRSTSSASRSTSTATRSTSSSSTKNTSSASSSSSRTSNRTGSSSTSTSSSTRSSSSRNSR